MRRDVMLSERIWKNFRWIMLRGAAPGGPRSRWVLAIGILAIVSWQLGFAREEAKLDNQYSVTAASGMHNDRNFVYFFWYTGLFPIASTAQYVPCTFRCPSSLENDAPTTQLSREAALAFINAHPDTLVQDITWTWYAGDRGKIFLFVLDTWLKGAPWKPSVRPFHRMCFSLSLVLLFSSMWRARRPGLGAFLVVFLGSNPFQLFEVHANENVFGWSITTAITMLAIHVPFLVGRRFDWRWAFAWPIGTGILLATIRTFRSEPMPILATVLFAYIQTQFWGAALPKWKIWAFRGGLVAAFFAAFLGVGAAWGAWFEHKQLEAEMFLRSVGGHFFPGPMRMYHHFWHPVWCGLGDFGEDKGYKWEDVTALAYARPILEQQYHEYVPNPAFGVPPIDSLEYWDAQKGFYKKLPYDMPHYDEVVRDKVLADIRADPKWYAGILWKRIKRVVGDATPVRIAWPTDSLTVATSPKSGKLFVVLLGFALLARVKFLRNLLVFTLPTCVTAILVYSDRGIAWYGIFHIVALAIWLKLLASACESGMIWWKRRAS